jgi:hypothetical protein
MDVTTLSLQGAIANFQDGNAQLFNELRFSQASSNINRNFMSIQNKIPNKHCRLQEAPKVLSMSDTPTKISIKIATITELQPALATGTIGKIPDAFTLPSAVVLS